MSHASRAACRVPCKRTFRNKLQWNFNQNTKCFIQEKASENIVSEIAAILSRGDELISHITNFSFLVWGFEPMVDALAARNSITRLTGDSESINYACFQLHISHMSPPVCIVTEYCPFRSKNIKLTAVCLKSLIMYSNEMHMCNFVGKRWISFQLQDPNKDITGIK